MNGHSPYAAQRSDPRAARATRSESGRSAPVAGRSLAPGLRGGEHPTCRGEGAPLVEHGQMNRWGLSVYDARTKGNRE